MGKVFSGEQIARGEIPRPGAHRLSADYILKRLFEDFESPIHAAQIYGSTAIGTASIRSDVDVLVVHSDGYARATASALTLARETFKDAEKLYHAPVEANVLSSSSAQNPLRHTIDPLFHEHLRFIQNRDDPQLSVGWPADIIRTNPITLERIRSIALRYAGAKARSFSSASVEFDGSVDTKKMQRALELPAAIGRKVLLAVARPGELPIDTNDKPAMTYALNIKLDEVKQDIDNVGVKCQYALSILDHDYTSLLHATLQGNVSIREYEAWLNRNYLDANRMAYEVSSMWSNIIENSWLRKVMKDWTLDSPANPNGEQSLFDYVAEPLPYGEAEDIY